MVADELNINKEAIRQILDEDLRKRKTQGRAEATEAHIIPELRPDVARQSQFSLLHFSIS
jgi:hypothetical protein